MIELTFGIILVISFGGIILLAIRKIPALIALPEVTSDGSGKNILLGLLRRSGTGIKQQLYKSKELKTKFQKISKQDKGEQIDTESDYWEKIRNG